MAQERREQPIPFREQAAERWVQRRLGRIGHERRVTAIATTLFDLMQDLHGLGPAHRRLLRLAAIVHDVGRQVDARRHPAMGAEMILEDTNLPINSEQRRKLVYLTRYHRGAVPEAGFDDILQGGDGRKAMRRVLAILRTADSLDNRNMTPPRIVVALKGRKLQVTCFIEEDTAKARRVLTRRKKFRLMEDLLDCKVEVEIKRAEAVQAV
ncbi:MAG TPA: HD domain-containing protein [Tepidisphaeraceae bacterium]|jgi:exopolyphosphatase/pppGpp-phosphohydrolase